MVKVTELIYKEQAWVVVDLGRAKMPYRYGTISKEDIVDGRLVRVLNGLQMMLEPSVSEAIKERKLSIDMREMKDAGMSDEDVLKTLLSMEGR